MSSILLAIIMFCGGMAVAVQPSINARLAERLGGVFESACVSFAVGTAALLLIVFIAGKGSLKAIPSAPLWELSGGLLGAVFVTLFIIAVPRIGTAAAMGASIGGQLTTGILLDYFGLFGIPSIPLDFKRLLGVALLILGAALILRH